MTTPPHSPFIDIGIDVSKEHLDIDLFGRPLRVKNTLQGLKDLFTKIATHQSSEHIRISLEATGSYTRLLVVNCLKERIPVSIINARLVRNYARASGQLAKTDTIDAKIITQYSQTFNPPCLSLDWEEQERLQQYHKRLDVLIQSRASRKTSLEHYSDSGIRAEIKREIKALDKRIETYIKTIDSIIADDTELEEKRAKMEQIIGVGPATSRSLICTFPELGTLNRKQAAALAGLAPMNRDSGGFRGKRCIQAGRAKPRKALYMAALTAAYRNPLFSEYFKSLRERGKPMKVALTAVARKLLIHINTQLKTAH